MLLQSSSSSSSAILIGSCSFSPHYSRTQNSISITRRPLHLHFLKNVKPSSPTSFVCLSVRVEKIAQIAHNKVLIAAAASAALGQLCKPFTSAILYGNKLDFMDVIRAGGFPSTHSSTVVAAATTLALERGFSDSIVGLAAVYAGLVMYDAQGVRREVSNHAKLLNRMSRKRQAVSVRTEDKNELIDPKPGASSFSVGSCGLSLPEDGGLLEPESAKASVFLEMDKGMRESEHMQCSPGGGVDVEEGSKQAAHSSNPLKESIGHTEFEVIAGALLGFIVSLVMYRGL